MLTQDIAFAIRTLRKTPGLTAVVAVSIALGIAANTTVFSMINATLLGALPVRDPNNLYAISGGRTFSFPEYRDYRDQCAGVFAGVSGHLPLAPASLSAGGAAPERVWGALVTGNYFSVVGPPLAMGRGITVEDDRVEGRSPVVVLGDSVWRRRFGADRAILGKTAIFNGHGYTIVGVMARGFHGSDRAVVSEFWAPLAMRSDFVADMAKGAENRGMQWIVISGRLKPGVSQAQALSAVRVVGARIHDQFRKNEPRRALTLERAGGIPSEIPGVTSLMAMLMVVVGLVLLIACANVANLLLAKAVERRREIGIRLALGAGRGRLVRQLLTESVLLSTLGAALGFGLAWFAARSLSNFQLPIQLPVSLDFTPDGRVLAFTAALAVATGIVFGLAPALMATRTDLVSAIKGSETSVGVFRRFGLRNLLVGLQVTFSVVLLVAAGLFVRSLGNAASMDLGIRPDHVLLMAVDPKTAGYSTERLREFLGQLETRVTALPGVRSVAASNLLPLSMAQNSDGFREVHGKEDKRTEADIYSVTPGYFETVGIPLVRGRNFSAEKDLKNPVAIVSRTMARRMFGDQDPIGRMIRSGEANSYEIVGISGDSKSVTLGEEVKACAYTYLPRNASEEVISLLGMTILVRATGDPAALTRPVRDEILKLDPTLAVFNVDTMTRHVSRAFLIPRLCATLFGIFGLLGLTLAGVGLFGVVGYSVRSRTREIGIRMALGARPAAVVRLVLSQGLGIVGLGMAIGLGISWGLSRFTSSLLYGLSATDVVTFTAVPLVLLATALAAVVLPARRAVTIHPMDALRLE